jgi:hypothetical protein
MTCDPERHWWTQDGPWSVSCDECGVDGVIQAVTFQSIEAGQPAWRGLFSDGRRNAA